MRGRFTGARPHLERRGVAVDGASGVGHRQASPRQPVVRIQRNRSTIELEGPPRRQRRELIREIPAAKVQVVCLRLSGLAPLQRAQPIGRQMQPHLVRNGRAQLALELEHTRRLAVEGRGPDLHLVAGANQPGRDAQPVALKADRALDQELGVQLGAHLRQRFRRALVGHHRRAADHAEVVGIHLAERRDDLLGQPVRDVLTLRIRAQVFERQNSQPRARRPSIGRRCHRLNRRDEAVATFRNRLDELRRGRAGSQRLRTWEMLCASATSSTKLSGHTRFRNTSFSTRRPWFSTSSNSVSNAFGGRGLGRSWWSNCLSAGSSEKPPNLYANGGVLGIPATGTATPLYESGHFSVRKLQGFYKTPPEGRWHDADGSAPCRRTEREQRRSIDEIEYEVREPGQYSASFGVWRQTGPRTYSAVTDAFILFSGGPFPAGTQEIRHSIHVSADGSRFVDDASVHYFDVNDAPVPPQPPLIPGCATAAGQRLEWP